MGPDRVADQPPGIGAEKNDWPAGDGRDASVYAAIDLGTNNCRMLVAKPQNNDFKVIDSFSRIVRLGEGAAARNTLSEAAMDRTVKALGICAAKIRQRGVDQVRGVATEACRQAANGGAFLDRVHGETGILLEPIPSEEEARLTLLGCGALLDRRHDHALVFDIGGGSTEIMWVEQSADGPPRLIDLLSIPFGVVTFAEHYGRGAVADTDYAKILDRVDKCLAPFDDRHGICEHVTGGRVRLLGTAGTVTTLAAVHLDLPRYLRSRVDGLDMDVDDAVSICRRLKNMDYEARIAHPCIGHGRADLVIMGCAILEAVCRRWPASNFLVADRGIREGLLMGMMAGDLPGTPPGARPHVHDSIAGHA